MNLSLTDEDILLKLRAFEDSFVERKTKGDHKDWLKTVVAFANSAPIGYPAILFIGVRNDGTVESDTGNLDAVQKSLSEKLSEAYPPVYYLAKVLRKDEKQFLAILVPGSESRPHFAGQSYVRVGSSTKVASEQEFDELIANRTDKAREILRWKDSPITVHILHPESVVHISGRVANTREMFVRDCNSFYATLSGAGEVLFSYPLRIVDISFDNDKKRLALELRPV